MSGSEIEQPEHFIGEIQHRQEPILKRASNESGVATSAPVRNSEDLEQRVQSQRLPSELERFSVISSEMKNFISDLSLKVERATEQLHGIRMEVEIKKKELETLHDIEVSATEMEQLLEAHRMQKETLDRLLESHRSQLEEEKARQVQEEREYLEHRELRRRREEEEYRKRWAEEQSNAKRKLEDEMRMIQRQNLEKQETLNKDLLQREQRLREKEQEWIRLVQELEEFMSRLTSRTQS
jgi:colicin import membrane protein